MVWYGMVWYGMEWNVWMYSHYGWFFPSDSLLNKSPYIDVSGREDWCFRTGWGSRHGWPDTTTMQKKVKPHERPGSTDEDSTGGFSIQKWDGHPLVTWAIGWISFPHHPLMGPKMAMKKRNCQGLDV